MTVAGKVIATLVWTSERYLCVRLRGEIWFFVWPCQSYRDMIRDERILQTYLDHANQCGAVVCTRCSVAHTH